MSLVLQRSIFSGQFPKWVLVAALLLGVVAGMLLPRLVVEAQAMEPQTYTVVAGSGVEFNTAILAFAPQSLQVHRGDTVQWVNTAVHNIHFSAGVTDLVIETEIDGKPVIQANPAALFPTVESGGVYQGGDVNSGVGFFSDPPMVTFSLVMDVEPGSYGYFCDVHPGMLGTITVVDDATPIPSPAEVLQASAGELAMIGQSGVGAAMEASMQPPTTNEDGSLAVSAGLQAGAAAVLEFFPSVAVVEAGQSVTWTIPENSMEPHTVTWPPIPPGSEFDMIPQEAGPPILALNESAMPSLENGAAVGADGNFSTGIMFPGQSYTLSFREPGVYSYVCFIHPGMQGTVVVN